MTDQAQTYTACPECGAKIVDVGREGDPIPMPERLEDFPKPDELAPSLLTCANGHVIRPRQDTLVLIGGGSHGLRVQFELADLDVDRS